MCGHLSVHACTASDDCCAAMAKGRGKNIGGAPSGRSGGRGGGRFSGRGGERESGHSTYRDNGDGSGGRGGKTKREINRDDSLHGNSQGCEASDDGRCPCKVPWAPCLNNHNPIHQPFDHSYINRLYAQWQHLQHLHVCVVQVATRHAMHACMRRLVTNESSDWCMHYIHALCMAFHVPGDHAFKTVVVSGHARTSHASAATAAYHLQLTLWYQRY